MSLSRRRFLKLSGALGAAGSLGRVAAAPSTDDPAPATLAAPGWRPRDLTRKPNIAVVVLDDVGFADFGCYGSELSTGCIDALAGGGVRFNNFHVTALCAPTRACLLTGRNAHAVGVGNIAEWGRDHPAYRGWIRQDAATLAEMLRPHAYSTLAIGKWHLSSIPDQNATGPYDHWPIGRGFDRWYGFHGNAADHWHPEVFENAIQVHPDKSDGYHLSEDLVDHAIDYVGDHIAAADDKPFFLYLAFGACHFPFHAPPEYVERQKGKYDAGWEAVRAGRYRRQRELGIIPEGTRLAPPNGNVTPWTERSADQRRVSARMQEVYAAFIEHTDDQLKRLVDFLAAEGQLEDTILLVTSDNGAASGGGPAGMLDVRRVAYQEPESLEHLVANLDRIGTEDSQCMYDPGWGQVSNTPLKWYKGDTYGGGTRSPLIVHWPAGGLAGGGIRPQYHHVIDVVPSLLEMIGAPFPAELDGRRQLPAQGVSFAYALDHPAAPTHKETQHFETLGDRAIWHLGWKAVVRHDGDGDFDDDVWELYHTDVDFAEIDDLAARDPNRLKALVDLWHEEAERYDILPLAANTLALYQGIMPRPRARHVFYPGMTRLDRLSAPDIYGYDSTMLADVELSGSHAEGVLLASGDGGAGYELLMQDGYLVFVYVYTREQRYELESPSRIDAGKHRVGLKLEKTGEGSATASLMVDGRQVRARELPKLWPVYSPNAGIRCGANTGAPISKRYQGPFAFNQRLRRVVVDVEV